MKIDLSVVGAGDWRQVHIGTTVSRQWAYCPSLRAVRMCSIPAAGMLISAYAVGVMVGALMTLYFLMVPAAVR